MVSRQDGKGVDPVLAGIASELRDSRVLFSEPMSEHTSFRIGGPCDLLVLPRTAEDAVKAWTMCRREDVPCLVVGNCTNLLVKDGGVRGCLIKMAPGAQGVEPTGDVSLRVKSGTLLPRLVQAAFEEGLSGLEWAVGIPGSAGGAVVMNAGAYGGDFGSLVERVEVASPDSAVRWLGPEEIAFSYRHSAFCDRDDVLVLSADIRLAHGDKARIYDVMQRRALEREEKQPLDMPSAGSAFRRPPGRYVGAILESLGLKGRSVGGAQVSPKHAGFIVNTGNATARDVLELMAHIRARVMEELGIELEPEIVVIGEDPGPDRGS